MKGVSIFFLAFLLPCVALATNDSIYVTFSGDTVNVWNTGVGANCASRFAFSFVYPDSNEIIITECDTAKDKYKCICTFDLCASLILATPGLHTVTIYRQYLMKYGYPTDTTIYVGSVSFFPGGLSSAPFKTKVYQSSCYANVVSVQAGNNDARGFSLSIGYPNPSNPSLTVRYVVPYPEYITLQVFDVLGRVVATLLNERRDAGNYAIELDRTTLTSSGTYFCRMSAGEFVATVKIVFVK